MRKRTEQRRNMIRKAAAELFCSQGYDQTSMDAVAAKVQMSKPTIYGYFHSKEDLFSSSMLFAIYDGAIDVQAILVTDDEDFRKTLEKFARAYVGNVSTKRAVDVLRTIIAISHTSRRTAAKLYKFAESDWRAVAQYFDKAKSRGWLRDVDSMLLAQHLKGLVESGIVDPLLYCTKPWTDLGQAPAQAVDAFLRAYGTEANR